MQEEWDLCYFAADAAASGKHSHHDSWNTIWDRCQSFPRQFGGKHNKTLQLLPSCVAWSFKHEGNCGFQFGSEVIFWFCWWSMPKIFQLKKYFLKYGQKSKNSYFPMTPSIVFTIILPHRLACVQSGFWLLYFEWSPFWNLSIVFNAVFTNYPQDSEVV